MKQRYITGAFLFSFLLISCSTFAQQFRWLTGGGSTNLLNNGRVQGEWITHMCTDDNGNVYSLAQVGDINIKADTFSQSAFSTSNSSWHILFMSHDCNGNMRFAKLLESKSNNSALGVAYHGGNIYVGGDIHNTGKRIGFDATFASVNQRAFLAKFDTSGNYSWLKFVGPDIPATQKSGGIYGAIDVDGTGNPHFFINTDTGLQITPSITSVWGTYDIKFDPNGNILSANKLQDIDSGYFAMQARIDKSTNKAYVLFGYGSGTTTRSYNALLAYNPNGTMIWKDTTNVRGGINNFRLKDGKDIYYVGGSSQAYPFSIKGMTVNNPISATGRTTVVGKLNISTGDPVWMYPLHGTNSVNALGDLTILPDNSIAAFGHYGGFKKYRNDTMNSPMGSNYRPWIFNIDTTGNLIDWTYIEGTDFYNYGLKITSDKKGNIYFGGEVPKDIKAPGLPQYTSNGGNSDFYIGKFGYDCNCATLANPSSNFSFSITDTLKKEVQFTFTGTTPNDSVVWRFGDASVQTATSPKYSFKDTGWYKVCAKVMVPCGRKVFCKDIYVPYKDTSTKPVDTGNSIATVNAFDHVKIYPNPANDVLYIDGLEPGSRIELYDIVGRKAHMIITAKENEVINMSYLPSGNYIIHLTDKSGRRMTGKVLKR